MPFSRYVAYYRVSTEAQGRSGLGLEAQKAAVSSYLNGGPRKLVAEYTETESGKRHENRPQLQAALRHARHVGATLVIAKLDRLSRDAHFLLGLQKAGVPFVAADLPEANEMVVGIMAVIAQGERKMISERTKAALAAAKARGVKLGNPNGARALRGLGNHRAIASICAHASARAADLRPVIDDIRAQGLTSLRAIAGELNSRGIRTARGGKWYATTVSNLLTRGE